jgi:hypothetical protein
VFYGITSLRRLVRGYRRFAGRYCLRNQSNLYLQHRRNVSKHVTTVHSLNHLHNRELSNLNQNDINAKNGPVYCLISTAIFLLQIAQKICAYLRFLLPLRLTISKFLVWFIRHPSQSTSSLPGKTKAIPVQAWTGPEGSSRLRLPDYMTTAHEDGKVVSLKHWLPLPSRKYSWYSFLLEAESNPGPCGRKDYV